MYRVSNTYPGRLEERFSALQFISEGISYPSTLKGLEGYTRAIQGMVGYCSGRAGFIPCTKGILQAGFIPCTKGILRGSLSAAGTLPERCWYAPWRLLIGSPRAPATLPERSCYAPLALLVRSPRAPGTLPERCCYEINFSNMARSLNRVLEKSAKSGSRINSFNKSDPRINSFNNSAKSGLNRSPNFSGEIERKKS